MTTAGGDSEESDRDRARDQLPPIRTFLGPELALPLPSRSRSAHSSSSSWDSVVNVQPWDIHELESTPNVQSSAQIRPCRSALNLESTHASQHTPVDEHFNDIDVDTSSPGPSHRPSSPRRQPFRTRASTVSSTQISQDTPPLSSLSNSPSRRPQFRTRSSTVPSAFISQSTPLISPASTGSFPPSPLGALPFHRSPSQPTPETPVSASAAYAYNVLRPSRSGGLITSVPTRRRRSRSQPHTTSQPRTASGGDGSRRHVCPVCQKRFSRPSSLRTHAIVHTRERPYVCTYPGCQRAFSVPSNMRRHLRTHTFESDVLGRGTVSDGEPTLEVEVPERENPTTIESFYQWTAAYRGP